MTPDRDLRLAAAARVRTARLAVGLLALLMIAAMAADAAPRFGATFYQFPTAPYQGYVVVADLNGDGKPDAIVANSGDNLTYGHTVSVFLGNGNETFGPRADFDTGTQPTSLAPGDVTGDGKPDLVVTNYQAATISVLPGNGDATFGAHADFATVSFPSYVRLGDLNGDGKLDAVMAGFSSTAGTITTLIGDGAGHFGSRTDYAIGASPGPVQLVDLSGDGKLDVAVTNGNGVSVFIGNGNGTLAPKTDYPTHNVASSVAVGDIDGDGRPDLAVTNYGGTFDIGNTCTLLRGKPGGTFGSATDLIVDQRPAGAVLKDVNGDGKLDLMLLGAGTSTQLGDGSGNFGVAKHCVLRPKMLAIADVNGDGRQDIVAPRSESGTDAFVVFLGNGDGSFGINDYTYNYSGRPADDVIVADLNGDGLPDVATASNYIYGVSVAMGVGGGHLGAPVNYRAVLSGYLMALATGDFNGDGKPDLATIGHYVQGTLPDRDSVAVLINAGNGTFGAPFTYGSGWKPDDIVAADFDGDGILDLAVANESDRNVSTFHGNGNGTFASRVNYGSSTFPQSLAAGDLNGDGHADLAVTTSSGVAILLADAGGGFHQIGDVVVGPNSFPVSIAIGDLNRDGIPDLAIVNQGYGITTYFSVVMGNGDGSFGPPTVYDVGQFAESVAIADLNGNGVPDLIVSNSTSTVEVLMGTGLGSFLPRVDYGSNSETHRFAIADMNSDGLPDVVTGRSLSVSVLLNTGGTLSVPAGPSAMGLSVHARANPVVDRHVVLVLSLASSETARLELIDIAGRRVAGQRLEELGPGRHVVELAPAVDVLPGVYFVRLTQDGRSAATRIAILR
jgi:hypothetical protein